MLNDAAHRTKTRRKNRQKRERHFSNKEKDERKKKKRGKHCGDYERKNESDLSWHAGPERTQGQSNQRGAYLGERKGWTFPGKGGPSEEIDRPSGLPEDTQEIKGVRFRIVGECRPAPEEMRGKEHRRSNWEGENSYC